jgi:uncharacterized membrane protein YecN with MAPEG domain
MGVPITAFYAGVYALLLLVLAARVSGFRMKLKVGLGDGGHSELTRAVRAHGNSVEWILPMLVLLLVAELNHANPPFLHACGSIFLAARIAHAVGLSHTAGESPGRFGGTTVTWLVIGVLAVWDIATFVRTML